MSTMTLEQATAKLADVSARLHAVANGCSGDYRRAMHQQAIEFDDARKAIDTHFARPAQAVDVGAIREVIDELREWEKLNYCEGAADKLHRALSGEKAGPVGDVLRVTVQQIARADADDACQVWIRKGQQSLMVGDSCDTREEGEWLAGQLRNALALPASPTPDKEG